MKKKKEKPESNQVNEPQELLKTLESKIDKLESINLSVSTSSVGWHIEHSLLVINVVIDDLQKSNPENYKWKFNFNRMIVFTLNMIPRGRAKARSIVTPKIYNSETLKAHLQITKETIKKLIMITHDNYLTHPSLGHLKLKDTIKFLNIHTRHHLKIINDILKPRTKI